MRFDGSPIVSAPPNATEPRRWATMPMIDLRIVVLPAPLRPRRVTSSPSATSNPTPCRICDSPYQAWRSPTLSSAASGMAGAHIGLDHLRIRRHRGVIALGEDRAAGQHGDDLGQIGDDRQIVLDHQHGAVARGIADERRDAADILLAET